MWDWLSKIDPNTVFAVVTGIALFIYHRVVPQKTQNDFDSTLDSVRAFAQRIIAVVAPGQTAASIETEVRGFAAVQLARLGYVSDNYPPILQAAVDAIVHGVIANFLTLRAANPPRPQAIPIIEAKS